MGGKQRRGWDPGKILLAGSAPPGLRRGWPVPNTGEDTGESGRSGCRGLLAPPCERSAGCRAQASVSGFKDVVKDRQPMHILDVPRTAEMQAVLAGEKGRGVPRGVGHHCGISVLICISSACPQLWERLLESGSGHENVTAYFSDL